jgi:hypothetical protein
MGFRREYVEIAGGLAAASLLSQIVYWHLPSEDGRYKLRVFRDGNWWVAKTRKQWKDECCLSDWQYRKALESLVAKGLVIERVMLFAGLTTTHVRLVHSRYEELMNEYLGLEESSKREVVKPDFQNGGIIKGGNEDPSITYTESTAKSTTESTGAASVPPKRDQGEEKEEETKEESKLSKEEVVPQLALDILKAQRLSETTKHGGRLALLWHQWLCEVDGVPPKPLTRKQLGQLSKIKRDLGELAEPVLNYVTHHWGRFSSEAMTDLGDKTRPMDPTLRYVLAAENTAKRLYLEIQHAPACPSLHSVAKSEEVLGEY